MEVSAPAAGTVPVLRAAIEEGGAIRRIAARIERIQLSSLLAPLSGHLNPIKRLCT